MSEISKHILERLADDLDADARIERLTDEERALYGRLSRHQLSPAARDVTAKALRIHDQQAARIQDLEQANTTLTNQALVLQGARLALEANVDELTIEFDRLYGAARAASMKLDVSVKRGEAWAAREYESLEEQIERLRPLFEQVIRRRG